MSHPTDRPAGRRRPGPRPPRRIAPLLVALAPLLATPAARGGGSADPLLRLVPAESSVVLAVEDLRDGAKRAGASSLADDLRRLPMVASWLASDRFNRLRRATGTVEMGLGLPVRTVIDEILGDAVVLVLQAGRNGAVDESSGLVLIRPRQPRLLDHLMETRSAAQARQGGLAQVEVRRHGGTSYQSRLFRPGAGPGDHYVSFDDGTFAWSNSEATIRAVIDQRAGTRAGWGSSPTFARLRAGLPDRALASLFVAPAVVDRVLATGRPAASRPRRYFNKVAELYLRAVGGMAFALEWRDGLVLHAHEILDPSRLPPWMARWLARPPGPSPLLGGLSPAAFGVVAARVDFVGALQAVRALVDDDDRTAWDAAEQAARGLALGQPLDDLAALADPHVLVTIEPKDGLEGRTWATAVGGIAWLDAGGKAAVPPWVAAENAFRTGMAVHAFRPLRRAQHYAVETKQAAGRPAVELGPPDRAVLACQSLADRLVIGPNAESIGRFAAAAQPSAPPGGLMALRERYAPGAETFAIFDLPRLTDAVLQSRKAIVRDLAARADRPAADVDRDLGQFLALANLFRAAVLTSAANRDATEVHRTVGLIAR